MRGEYLFAKVDMFSVIEHQKKCAAKKVQELDPAYLQQANENELVSQIVAEYGLEVPVIEDDKIYVADYGESQVDVSRDFRRAIFDRSKPFFVSGTKTIIAVPFRGDAELFKVQPNTFTTTRPSGKIVGQEIHLLYTQAEPNSEAIKREYTKTVQEIRQYLDWQRPAAEELGHQLESLVRQRIMERKEKLLAGTGMIEDLGLPIRKLEQPKL